MDNLVQQEWFELLAEECKAIVTEAVFTSRWALVEGYWELGKRINEDINFKKYEKGNQSSLQDLANNIGISKRTVYYARQFHERYPNLDEVPEGKNISWNKIVTKYLGGEKEERKRTTFNDVFNKDFDQDIMRMGQEIVEPFCKKYNFPGSVSGKYDLYQEIYKILEKILKNEIL